MGSTRHAGRRSPCIIRSKRSTGWSRRCIKRERCLLNVLSQMTEKTQKEDNGRRGGGDPEAAAAEERAEIKTCVGAAEGGEGTLAPIEGPKGDGSAIPKEELERLRTDLIAALKTVFDPEIPVDSYELGLIYRLDGDDERNIEIDMTLTAPGCPVAGDMPGWVENAVSAVPGVGQVKVNLVFDPPWDMSRMSDEAKLELNMF